MTEDQERLDAQQAKEKSDMHDRIYHGLSKETKSALIIEAMRQASEDQRKVLDQAQDSNKIYWKG